MMIARMMMMAMGRRMMYMARGPAREIAKTIMGKRKNIPIR